MQEVIRFYIGEARAVKGKLVILLVSEGFSGALLALLPLMFALLVDKITEGDWEFVDFLPILLLITALEIIERLLYPLYFYAMEKVEIEAGKNIARCIFSHLSQKSLAFHGNRLSGNLVADADKTTQGFGKLVSFLVENMFSNFIFFVVMFISLATQAPQLLLPFFLACILLLIIGWRIRRTEADPSLEESRSDSLVSAHLADTLGNIETVIASGEKESEIQFYDQRIDDWERDARKLWRKQMRNSTIIHSIPLFIILPLLFVGVFLVTNDYLSAGTLLLLLLYGQRIVDMANSVNMSLTETIRTLNQAKPMVDVLQEKIEIPDRSEQRIHLQKGHIAIKNISFAYPGKDNLFQSFSLEIKAKERVGLVGLSGSGKSTLLRLLLRMVEPSSGKILFDDQNIADYKADSLRQQISYVGQEPILFHRSIRDNIAYGSPTSLEKVRDASRAAWADNFIEKLPDGYKSKVGDRGVQLSGGERQRIVLARAFLRRSPVLLLDEPTSALDSYSEELIQKALEELFQNKTALVIAHRLSTIAHLDRIIVLDDGQIAEEGNHHDLIRQDGLYAKLWQKQSEGFLQEMD